ncbi:tegument protein vICA [Aotine betaherpesvirus 1]|uniref:Tegument protein vICA n=1 Tax=Aotine betaherpesvirus 1 TaxID=50290 RepID=G8XUB1_9BETA|nr:tegument protein vICA [Aotine betaherpesvirus 1]AEV80742.1 tegument protein vICA [Aotine betaherpesvirus 1]
MAAIEVLRHVASLHHDFSALDSFLESESGLRLPLEWPPECFIQLRSLAGLGYFEHKYDAVCNKGRYVCCKEKMHPFGFVCHCARQWRYRYVLLLGASGSIYCYDDEEQCVYMVARSVEVLCSRGLRNVDSFYAYTDLVPPGIECDEHIEQIIEVQDDLQSMAETVADIGCRVYPIIEPAGIDTHFAIYTTGGLLYKTFTDNSVRNEALYVHVMGKATTQIACLCDVVGVLGCMSVENVFLARIFVLVDSFGVVYGYNDTFCRVSRLADNFEMFIRILGRKALQNYRYDSRKISVMRLEKPPVCFHTVHDVLPEPQWDAVDNPFEPDREELCEADRFSAFLSSKRLMEDYNKHEATHELNCVLIGNVTSGCFWAQEMKALTELPVHATSRTTNLSEARRYVLSLIDLSFEALCTKMESEDSDEETITSFIFKKPCQKCVCRKRWRLFRAGRKEL